jgi:hypothetical protein
MITYYNEVLGVHSSYKQKHQYSFSSAACHFSPLVVPAPNNSLSAFAIPNIFSPDSLRLDQEQSSIEPKRFS